MESRNLAELYDLPTLDWQVVVDRLDAGFTQVPGTDGPDRHTCWLATIDADGRPHVTGIGAMWHDGAFWFETGKDDPQGPQQHRSRGDDARAGQCLAEEAAPRGVPEQIVALGHREPMEVSVGQCPEGGIHEGSHFGSPTQIPVPSPTVRADFTHAATPLHVAAVGRHSQGGGVSQRRSIGIQVSPRGATV
jgi:Pyridoxamine 5'-phosphate oxidase